MWNNQKLQKLFSFKSNLQTYYHFKVDFQKVDQHTGGKWLIHGTKRHKDNQLQSLELPCRIYHDKHMLVYAYNNFIIYIPIITVI